MASTAGGDLKPELIKSEHNVGYDPIKEEDTDDEGASKVQPTEVNAKIEKVNVKDEDTDDEFSEFWISYCVIHIM